MSTINKNMLSPIGFNFEIRRLPSMNFFVQSVTLPGATLGTIERPNPFRNIPIFGDKIDYSELEVTFKINEDMTNYLEVFNWITALGFPDNFDQFKELSDKPRFSDERFYSDATLTILSSAMNPNIQVFITDLFPVSLSPIVMDTRGTDVEYIEASASFRFQNYTFKTQNV